MFVVACRWLVLQGHKAEHIERVSHRRDAGPAPRRCARARLRLLGIGDQQMDDVAGYTGAHRGTAHAHDFGLLLYKDVYFYGGRSQGMLQGINDRGLE